MTGPFDSHRESPEDEALLKDASLKGGNGDDDEQFSPTDQTLVGDESPKQSFGSHGSHDRLMLQPPLESLRLREVDEAGASRSPPIPTEDKQKPVAWKELPRKDQLLILTLARLSEPLVQTSLQSYMFYQLRSFDPKLPDATISWQAGVLHASFPAAQFTTSMLWGVVADAKWGGRKRVILTGLTGTCISCLGFGFARSFNQALMFRCLGGMLNGNVGTMRTMISEIIKEKKYQSRAFLLLPMTFNIGVIIGPIIGGYLADPVKSYPKLFGSDSIFGGKDGVAWMKHFPYALPNLVSACFLLMATFLVVLGLEESLDALRGTPDWGLRLGRWLWTRICRRSKSTNDFSEEHDHHFPRSSEDVELQPFIAPSTPITPTAPQAPKRKLPFRRIFTPNVTRTLIAHGLLASHVGTMNSLFNTYLSTPRANNHPIRIPHSNGGLALPPHSIGTALTILGFIGITLQLTLYPRLSFRLGTVPSYRIFLVLFPIAYTLAPFLSIVPSPSAPPDPASGYLLWTCLTLLLTIHVLARTFALPATTILVNNCSPHPSVLGTVHGIGQSVSSFARTVGPIAGGWAYGRGLEMGVVGVGWWCLAGVAVLGWGASWFVREGSGHEVWLEGEEEMEGLEGGRR